ncbi:hypothetical protein HD806DRAFT_536329 [Xylariaceae sp. AK1471]|nr:hypothetical protein HD806DRAFT_536329 [Xylariaceae sp. AK1471]
MRFQFTATAFIAMIGNLTLAAPVVDRATGVVFAREELHEVDTRVKRGELQEVDTRVKRGELQEVDTRVK